MSMTAVSRLRDFAARRPARVEIANYIRRGKLWEAFRFAHSPRTPDRRDGGHRIPNDLLPNSSDGVHVYTRPAERCAPVRPSSITHEKELLTLFYVDQEYGANGRSEGLHSLRGECSGDSRTRGGSPSCESRRRETASYS